MLTVGRSKFPILDRLQSLRRFLIIDGGAMIDALDFPHRKITVFDYQTHSFDPTKPLRSRNAYEAFRAANDFITLMNARFPEGQNTLTKKNSNFVLLNALLHRPRKLDRVVLDDPKDPARHDAYQKIQTLLLSPVLRQVFLGRPNFSLKGCKSIVTVRLDPKQFDPGDRFILANLLMSQYEGPIVVPDYGFYAAPHHASLIREGRLIAGIDYLDQSPADLKNLFLLDEVIPARCTFADAETLAHKAGIPWGITEWSDFVYKAMKG